MTRGQQVQQQLDAAAAEYTAATIALDRARKREARMFERYCEARAAWGKVHHNAASRGELAK